MAKEKKTLLDKWAYEQDKKELERATRINRGSKIDFLEEMGFITSTEPEQAMAEFIKYCRHELPDLLEVYKEEISRSNHAEREFMQAAESYGFVSYPYMGDNDHNHPWYKYPIFFLGNGFKDDPMDEDLVKCLYLERVEIGRGRARWEVRYNDDTLRALHTHTLSKITLERMENLQKIADQVNKTFAVGSLYDLFKYFYTSPTTGELKVKHLRPCTWEKGEGLK